MKHNSEVTTDTQWRKSTQELAPVRKNSVPKGKYDLYPAFKLEEGRIDRGFKAIADQISGHERVVIDGFIGVFWQNFRKQLNKTLEGIGKQAEWIDVSGALRDSAEIEEMVTPYLGGDDPIFGTRFEGELKDFFDPDRLEALGSDSRKNTSDITILYGCGSCLVGWDAPVMYVDLPKNELQFRSRVQSVANLGRSKGDDPKKMYKRFYFVDWVVLNKHKKEVVSQIDWIVDEQHPDDPAVMRGDHFREALNRMSKNYFRVRPWFEPGTWGGQWCKKNIPGLPQDAVNIAWSFELIAPENGLMLRSDDYLLEASFDWLMYQEHESVLGEAADQFRYDFPIRFDFLDTVGGGNLSVQCHPKPAFIREQFGESFTQDETYYILDCKPDAQVYLGFQEDINADEFREELETSAEQGTPVEINNYVQQFTANKHDLFLIPHGTIHCSGEGNLVLEISATPYIFTFKMYDWLRLDLDGNPRPLNIERAFKNLNFEHKGSRVKDTLLSRPEVIKEGKGWQVVHLPTHKDHFYDVHRMEFSKQIKAETGGNCHVMSLVEGSSIVLETENGLKTRFNYAETFAVPASAGSYKLINEGGGEAKVIKAFVKPGAKLREN